LKTSAEWTFKIRELYDYDRSVAIADPMANGTVFLPILDELWRSGLVLTVRTATELSMRSDH
jgi:hypothetical protein